VGKLFAVNIDRKEYRKIVTELEFDHVIGVCLEMIRVTFRVNRMSSSGIQS